MTFTRDVAAVTMDVGTTETLQFNGLGGGDTINVGVNLAALTTVSWLSATATTWSTRCRRAG